jgi:SAM-dependent methyltransferase
VKRDDWNRRYAESELLWTAQPNRFLVAEADDLRPGRALDLACGEGRSAIWLAEQGWQATGIDFSEVALEKGRRLAQERGVQVEFLHADLLEYEPPESAFDLVCILYLQVPADERRLVLRRAAAAVAPGGTLLLVAHDTSNLEGGTGGPSDPAVLYTPEEVAVELPGLEIEKAERVLRPVAGAERPAIDALVRARRPRD